MVSHTERIVCPECHRTQTATVEHTRPWYVYIHECECGYTITESEWEEDGDDSIQSKKNTKTKMG